MKILSDVKPTSEQLKLFVPDPKVMIIKGAAGSGKTTTCLLRLRIVINRLENLKKRAGETDSLKVLVFSYNKTLGGYISELAESQKKFFGKTEVLISTFALWAYNILNVQHYQIVDSSWKKSYLSPKFAKFPQSEDFLNSELEYILGRFPHDKLEEYITCERTGRGLSPRFDGARREQFLNDVVYPYIEAKKDREILDFSDLAYQTSILESPPQYDIIIIDEGQDFSANELRAVMNVLKEEHSLTIVIDSAQKIYAKSFLWKEIGLKISSENVFSLTQNFRNTKEIAQFIVPIIQGVDIGGDYGAPPSPDNCHRRGPMPTVLEGKYSEQLNWVMQYKIPSIDLTQESLAFLHPKGWFDTVKKELENNDLSYVNLTKIKDWPDNDINIGLVTMHSAKGLEFDHVVIIGLNKITTPYDEEVGDVFHDHFRRLFAMSCGRARESLTIGYKKDEMSSLVKYFDIKTYNKIIL